MEFVNEYPVLKPEEFHEVNYRPLKYTIRESYKLFNWFIFLLGLLFVLYSTRVWQAGILYSIPMGLIIWVQPAIVARIQVAMLRKRNLIMKNPNSIINRVIFEDDIQIYWDAELIATSQFETMKFFIETNHFIVLELEGQVLVPFKKNGFTIGTTEEFINRLRELGVKEN